MSGDISADIVGVCECRHRSPSCAYCGGWLGFAGPPPKPRCRACVASIAAEPMTLEQLAAYCVEAGQSPEQAEATALQMLAVAAGTLPHIRESLAIAFGDDDELLLVDDKAPTEVLDRADVVAALAPIDETWRRTWTECADLLKSVAEKDPAAAAGYVARCREWLTRAVQYGS